MRQTRAYVITGKWDYARLSGIGKLSRVLSCGSSVDHMGIAFFDCSYDMVEAHSMPDVSHPTAVGDADCSVDFMGDKFPLFQGLDNGRYWSDDCDIVLYPVKDIDAKALHEICIEIVESKPYNNDCYRCNPLLGGCWCCACGFTRQPYVGQSHCAALTMRALAAAKAGTSEPLRNDRDAQLALGIEHRACSPRRLVGYTPTSAVRALIAAGVVGEGRPFRDDAQHLPLLGL
jgi:hypothetical protein